MATQRVTRMAAVPKSRPKPKAKPKAKVKPRASAKPKLAPNKAGKPTGFTTRTPASAPVGAFSTPIQLDQVLNNTVTGTVPASGAVTLRVGPMGLGTVWYPTMAAGSTTTGATDTSTVAVYLSPVTDASVTVPANQIGGQVFTGGGWSVGLPGTAVFPGYFVIAVWTGAKAGDTATLIVYGTQKVLT
jgi:hypothetical protein